MFSFFRRSKKDEGRKQERGKSSSPKLNHRRQQQPQQQEVRKNTAEKLSESAPQLVQVEPKSGSEFANNVPENSVVIGAQEALEDMNHFFQPPFKPPSEPPKNVRNVKPCGHGTVAIQPRIPLQASRRDSLTPPESPKADIKNPYKKQKNEDAFAEEDLHATTKTKTNPLATPTVLVLTDSIVENAPNGPDVTKNLINQEAKFQGQLNELSKQLSSRDAEANKLRFQMEELQRDVFAKSAGMDRLQAELQASHKESEYVRTKLKHLEEDLDCFRRNNSELNEEIRDKNDNLSQLENVSNAKIHELENTIKELRQKIEVLEKQIEDLRLEKEKLEEAHKEILIKTEEEKRAMEEALEKSKNDKLIIDKKWEQEFEKLRTVSMTKEEQMMGDFEWKLREVEKSCKKRLEDKERQASERLQETYKDAENKMKEAEELMAQIESLKVYQVEAEQLRGVTKEQQEAINLMKEQQEQMKTVEDSLKAESKKLRKMVDLEKENLLHMQLCHNREIQDRERKLQITLNQKRTEIAMYWEERLLHEIGRLKTELEQLYLEEKYHAINVVKQEKEDEFGVAKKNWDRKIEECLREITLLKRNLEEKEKHYQREIIGLQTKTDLDILELRRIMDKIDMSHHDRFENLVKQHEDEIERINDDSERKLKEVETAYQNQLCSLRTTLDLVREQMEHESQQKLQNLIAQHRAELDTQWEALIHQKSEAVQLVEEEYVSKYKTMEEQFYTQQKSHEAREIELLKTIDSLKNEITSKDSTIDDLQNNLDTMDGGIQVLNQEIAQQNEELLKARRNSDQKVLDLQEQLEKLQNQLQKERDGVEAKISEAKKDSQQTIEHLQRKCQCLTKLFEEVRARYERRDSRQEDLNTIADLKRVIAEQEKDLACLNEEKRYIQMRLMSLERSFDDDDEHFEDSEDFEAAASKEAKSCEVANGYAPSSSLMMATIPECDDCDDDC